MLILLLDDAWRDQDIRREETLKIPVKWHLSQKPGKIEKNEKKKACLSCYGYEMAGCWIGSVLKIAECRPLTCLNRENRGETRALLKSGTILPFDVL